MYRISNTQKIKKKSNNPTLIMDTVEEASKINCFDELPTRTYCRSFQEGSLTKTR